jgi:hypothetical protein
MRKLLPALLVLVTPPLAALAQEAAPSPAKVLAPYMDELTFAVGVVDVQNIDLDAMLTRLQRFGAPKDEIEAMKPVVGPARGALVKAGGRYVCFTFNLADHLGDGPLIAIPIAKGGDAAAVAGLIEKMPGVQVHVKDAAVLVASKPTLERALKRTPAKDTGFSLALAAANELPTRVAFVMPPPLRKALEEFVPRLPPEFGGAPITPVTRGMTWAVAGLDLSAAKLQMRAVVQANDPQAAMALGRLADRFLELARLDAKRGEQNDLLKGLQTLQPEVRGDRLLLTLDAKAVDTAILPIGARVRAQATRDHSVKNLGQIAVAMHEYHDVHKAFPAQASYDAQKRPLLSWRVHLLPFLYEKALYDQFKLDEPWDSAHNKALISKMPRVYRSPFIVDAPAGKTSYLVPTGPGLIFDGPKTTKITEITDGTSNTLFLVEAVESRAVEWTKPEDYAVDRKKPKVGLLLPGGVGIIAAFVDGSVHVLPAATRDDVMWLYFNPNDGMPIPADPTKAPGQ